MKFGKVPRKGDIIRKSIDPDRAACLCASSKHQIDTSVGPIAIINICDKPDLVDVVNTMYDGVISIVQASALKSVSVGVCIGGNGGSMLQFTLALPASLSATRQSQSKRFVRCDT